MTNNNPAVPPPPRAGAGCFGIGCMSFLGFFLFLAVVVIAGGAWGLHHLRGNYSANKPLPIPAVDASGPMEGGFTLLETPSAAPTPESSASTDAAATPGASAVATPIVQRPNVAQGWKEFQKAAKRHDHARIELSAADINGLISNGKNTRGKAFVRIQNNVGYVTVSVPLNGVTFMKGRYLNGQATVKASPDGDTAKMEISDVTIGNESVPDDFLDRRVFGNSIRSYVTQWLDNENITSFKIENDRAIGETGG